MHDCSHAWNTVLRVALSTEPAVQSSLRDSGLRPSPLRSCSKQVFVRDLAAPHLPSGVLFASSELH